MRTRPDGEEEGLATLGPGQVFGEIGIPTEARRNASVRAKTNARVLALGWNDFKELVEASEPTAKDFAEIMKNRLTETEA